MKPTVLPSLFSLVLFSFFAFAFCGAENNANAADKTYTLSSKISGQTAIIEAKPKKGFKINEDFPASINAEADDGIELKKSTLKKGDADKLSKDVLRFKIPFKAKEGAKGKKISAKMKFGTCQVVNGEVTNCRFHREKITFKL